MPTVLLPNGKVAILVLDCQNDIVDERGKMGQATDMPQIIKERNIFGTLTKLIAAGRDARAPIIYSRNAYRADYADAPTSIGFAANLRKAQILQDGTWGAEIHGEVAPQPQDFVFTKTRVGAFYGSPLEAILNSLGVTHLIMTGFATDGVVDTTARDGADRGYHVFVVEDCCATVTYEAHRAVLSSALGAIVTICTADDVIQALA